MYWKLFFFLKIPLSVDLTSSWSVARFFICQISFCQPVFCFKWKVLHIVHQQFTTLRKPNFASYADFMLFCTFTVHNFVQLTRKKHNFAGTDRCALHIRFSGLDLSLWYATPNYVIKSRWFKANSCPKRNLSYNLSYFSTSACYLLTAAS